MKYFNRKLILASLLTVAIATSSCKKNFLDVNDDPNRVTDSNVTAELVFANAAVATGNRAVAGNFLQNWVGYLSSSGDFAIQQQETSYNIDFGFGDGYWQAHYGVLFDLNTVQQKAAANNDVVLAAASMILSAKLWQELVDLFGNIPYSEAFKNNLTRTPKYDDGAVIYGELQKKLDTAITYMSTGTAKSTFTSVDIINKGATAKWIKFANTLKLRMLIRQSEVGGFDPTAELAKIKAAGGVLGAGETVSVNPGFANDVNKQSPFYATYGFTSAATPADANTAVRANVYFVNLLNSNADPRLSRVYSPAATGGTIVGTTYGLAAGNPDGAHSSKFGPGLLGANLGTTSTLGASQDQWIMTSVESMFLAAEAIARGWVIDDAGLTPQQAYEAAVTESFVWLKVPNATTAAADYLATVGIAQWANAGATPASRAKFIAVQKYIGLVGIDPLESYSDIRRLDMLTNKAYISVNPSRLASVLPNRLLYPQSEYTTNSDNVKAQGTINQFTSKIFWQP